MQTKFKVVLSKVSEVASRYPLVLAFSFSAALSAATIVRNDDSEFFPLLKFMLVCLLGISLSFGLHMASQRYGKALIFNIIGVAVLLVMYFILPDREQDFTEVYAYVLIPGFILSHLFVAFAPYILRGNEFRFWHYNKNLLINLVLSGIFTGVLTAGIVLALLAINNLFDLNFRDNVFGQTVVFTAIIGSTFSFLVFCGKGLKELEDKIEYPAVLKFFTQFILIPLLIIYAVILYVYAGKIILQQELPRGWVSYLILAYSVVGILANLLVHPLKNETQKSWVKLFSRIFYYTLLPLLVLLFTAIFTRILEYGYTEARYYVLLLAIWITVITVYFLTSNKGYIRIIPQSMFLFGLFGLIFPFLNSFAVAERSQKRELNKLLVEKKILHDGKLDVNKKIKYKTLEEVLDKVTFLADRGELGILKDYLPSESFHKILVAREKSPHEAKIAFQNLFKNVNYTEAATENNLRLVLTPAAISAENYTHVLPVLNAAEKSWTVEGKKITYRALSYTQPNSTYEVSVSAGDRSEIYSLRPYFDGLSKKYAGQTGRIETNLSHEFKIDNLRFKIYFNVLNMYRMKDSYNIEPETAVILVRKE